MIRRVTVRREVATGCPNGGEDLTEVAISWEPGEHVDAEALHAVVDGYYGCTLYCEDLAQRVARLAAGRLGRPVIVVARQLRGHGVEVEAEGRP